MKSEPAHTATATGDQYRALMSAFPTGVAVITSLTPDGDPCGMTCSSLTSVTMSPPTLLVCLQTGTRTASAVVRHGAFAVNLLCANAQPVAEMFSAPIGDRFSRIRWDHSASGLPWLSSDAFALAECAVTETLSVGDHVVAFGRVERIAYTAGTPLLYGLRQFATWDPPRHDTNGYAQPSPRW